MEEHPGPQQVEDGRPSTDGDSQTQRGRSEWTHHVFDDESGRSWLLEIEWQAVGDSPSEPVGMLIRSDTQRRAKLTAKFLRKVPLHANVLEGKRDLEARLEEVARSGSSDDHAPELAQFIDASADIAKQLLASANAAKPKVGAPRSDVDLARVAEVYRNAARGKRRQAVCDEFVIGPSGANKLIMRARKANLLPPTPPGVASV